MEQDFNYKDVPAGYQLCFNSHCPRREECLRWVASQKLPTEVKWGPAIFPTALGPDGSCDYYNKMSPMLMAWGFDKLFYNVLSRDELRLRTAMQHYLGGKTPYYRYNRGERLLTPDQQAWILDLFRSAGYTRGLEFEGYVTAYNFH